MVQAVPWGYHVNLLSKLNEPAPHRFYLKATARFGWNRNVLLNQIAAPACDRSLAEGKVCKFALALPGQLTGECTGTSIGSAQLKRDVIDPTPHTPQAINSRTQSPRVRLDHTRAAVQTEKSPKVHLLGVRQAEHRDGSMEQEQAASGAWTIIRHRPHDSRLHSPVHATAIVGMWPDLRRFSAVLSGDVFLARAKRGGSRRNSCTSQTFRTCDQSAQENHDQPSRGIRASGHPL